MHTYVRLRIRTGSNWRILPSEVGKKRKILFPRIRKRKYLEGEGDYAKYYFTKMRVLAVFFRSYFRTRKIHVLVSWIHTDRILIFRMNCSHQSIDRYASYNSRLYGDGVDMQLVIQSFFGPHQLNQSNTFHLWLTDPEVISWDDWGPIYSRYLDHPVVYGIVGLHPLFAHKSDFETELTIRQALNHSCR